MPPTPEFTTDRIRNIAVLGHAGSGKTTLVDALAFATGATTRKGDVEQGQALTLTTPEEVAHRVSMQLTPASTVWMDTKLNLIDTPGYLDFTGEAYAAVQVADAAVVVVNAAAGVEVGTEKVWEYCRERGIPRILFVSMMDREHADFDAAFSDIRGRLAPNALPIEIPIGSGEGFRGLVNLFREQAHFYRAPDGTGAFDVGDIPGEVKDSFQQWRNELQETLATLDEELLEQYLEGGGIAREEAIAALARGMAGDEIVPVLLGSPRTGYGLRALLRRMVQLLPHPGDAPHPPGTNGASGPTVTASDASPFCGLVFKTVSEAHVGNLALFRVCSGLVSNGDTVLNPGRGVQEKLHHLSIPRGKDRPEVARLHAGDIGVVAKLRDTHTNDTLADPEHPVVLPGIPFPRPDIALAVRGVSRTDDDRLGEVLAQLREEDPCFESEYDGELHQTIVRGMGELHLEIQMERMERRYGVRVETERPRIRYRETISRSAEAQGRFKKQTGGRGQFGDCWIRLEPLPPGAGFEFVDAIRGGVIPGKFVPSVERGVREAAQKGVLAGFPVVDFRAVCYDGSFHSVDSSDIAFQVAGSLAFQKAARMAGPVLLEPMVEVHVSTPEAFMGEVLADITQRRGKVLGMEGEEGRSVIRARVPDAELYKYATALRAMSQGRAHHTRRPAGYEAVPDAIVRRIVGEAEGKAS